MAASLAVAVMGRVCGAAVASAARQPCKIRERAGRRVRESAERCNWHFFVSGALRRWADDPELIAVAGAGLGTRFDGQAGVVVRAAVLAWCEHVATGGRAKSEPAVRVWLGEQVAVQVRIRLLRYLAAGLYRRWGNVLTEHARGLLPPTYLSGSEGALVRETLARFIRRLLSDSAAPSHDPASAQLQEIMAELQQRREALEGEIAKIAHGEKEAANRGGHGRLWNYSRRRLSILDRPTPDTDPENFVQQAYEVLLKKAHGYDWEGAIERRVVSAGLRGTIRQLIFDTARRRSELLLPDPQVDADDDDTQPRPEDQVEGPMNSVAARLELADLTEQVLRHVPCLPLRRDFEKVLGILQDVADGSRVDEACKKHEMSRTQFYGLLGRLKSYLLRASWIRNAEEDVPRVKSPNRHEESDRWT